MNDNIEITDNDIGKDDQDITQPFATKDIKITNAPVLLASLINRLHADEIDLNPDFQRHANLWTISQMSRLIESILLKLPLPIFYFDVSNPDKWIVVDGLQRLSTIKKFFIDESFKLKNLEFLYEELNGKNYDDLERVYKRTVDETQIITYQIEGQTPKKVRYSIFNRINTGGLPLKPQEIRQALNQDGKGVNFLSEMVEDTVFKRVVAISNKRMAGQELVLRFIAFQILDDKQFKTMGNFLDLAMEEVDKKDQEALNKLKEKLINVLEFSEKVLGENHKFSRSIADSSKNKLVNLSLFDVLTVCFDEIGNKDLFLQNKHSFVDKLKKLLLDENSAFFTSITKGTSGRAAKETRFKTIRGLIKETI